MLNFGTYDAIHHWCRLELSFQIQINKYYSVNRRSFQLLELVVQMCFATLLNSFCSDAVFGSIFSFFEIVAVTSGRLCGF